MVSPAQLRPFPLFGDLDDVQLAVVARLTREAATTAGELIFAAGTPATHLYLLADGTVDLYLIITRRGRSENRQALVVSEVGPGQAFGISAVLAPGGYALMARAAQPGRVLIVDAGGLREHMAVDAPFGRSVYHQLALVSLQRLQETRAHLAAAWA
jgi:CRP-like cAMP-binding protein